MDVFVARQPIFDRNKKIFAYELLFRAGMSNGFPDIDGNTATSSLLSSSFFTVGIEKIAAGKKAFINFTEQLILKEAPHLFSKKKLVVEILEDVEPSEAIVAACKELKEQGYQLALDDFVYSKRFDSLIALSDIIKIDFRLTPAEEIKKMVPVLQQFNCKLLAEKVETHEEFKDALSLGFDYFQGYFFAKPEVLKNRDLSTSKLTMLRLISQMNSKEFDVAGLEELVVQDVSISYKLLNYLNSAKFSRLQPLSSVRQAISFLGERGFRQFTSLVATSRLADDKPNELLRISIIRARFLERIGLELKANDSELFLLGLFSCIDAMLDRSLEEIFTQLPLSENITAPLVERKGELFIFLRLIETYESGNWVAYKYAQKKVGLEDEKIVGFYLEAISWADSFSNP
ncbi:MAG: EAL domain-containing protein [Desulfopila sp.]|jgi:EAL and modified HD-GYP domain-containing signal transduction protein|nr:EAL domain-containing protein [Desulfopila sp.]